MHIVKIVRRMVMPLVVMGGIALPAGSSVTTPTQPAEWCKRLVVRLPGISDAACQRSSLSASGAHSLLGFPLLARQIPAVKTAASGPRPLRVLLMGGIHGDELTAPAIVFRWMQWMPTPAAQQFEWKVLPVVNPDGLLANKATRVNAHGVDLNRNFPTPGWQQEAPRYWAARTKKDPRRFPGTAPLSEPETRWVNEEMVHFRPDVIVSVHAPFGLLDFDGSVQPPNRFGRLMLDRVGVYPGSLGNYSGIQKDVPVITIELPNAQKMPTDAEVQRIWLDMLHWINNNVVAQADPVKVRSAALPASDEKPARARP